VTDTSQNLRDGGGGLIWVANLSSLDFFAFRFVETPRIFIIAQ
jgi:hypothetical protein